MIEVFKTDVSERARASELCVLLQAHFPGSRITFDIDDCDNVLRVEGNDFMPEHVSLLMQAQGCNCEVLR